MTRYISALMLLFAVGTAIAQPADMSNAQPDEIKLMIKGIVQDSETGHVLEFAAVSVFAHGDESLVGGTVTDINGVFALEVDAGVYDIKIEFISFDPHWVREVVVNRDQPVADLGSVTLTPSAQIT